MKEARREQAAVGGEVMPAGAGPVAEQGDTPPASGYRATMDMLTARVALFGRAAPDGGPSGDQLVTDTMTALSTVPKLSECEPRTIIGAVITCAQLGLRIGGALGQAWILPFWHTEHKRREATFVLGYKGLVLLAHQSGMVRGVTARTVYEKEVPRFMLAWHENRDELRHEPWLWDNPGPPMLYYARVLLPDGGYEVSRPINREAMREHRQRYVKAKSGPWWDDRGVPGDGFEAMAHKTALKRLGRVLPLSSTARRAIAVDGGVRVDENPNAAPDTVTDQPDQAETEPGHAAGNPDAAFDERGWPEGATTGRPGAGA